MCLRMKFSGIILAFMALSMGLLLACSEHKPSQPYGNLRPETHLSIILPQGMETPDTTVSRQVLHWWGDDPDGQVVGFYWAWEDTSCDTCWIWTTANQDTFQLRILTQYDSFTFYVKAVDNTAVFDGVPTDSTPPIDAHGAVDHTPATMSFPIMNSAPEMRWPAEISLTYAEEDYVSFHIVTFNWEGTDPDGDDTIVNYLWALDFLEDQDTSLTWHALTGSPPPSYITLEEQDFQETGPGRYRFYVKAVDVAGAISPTIAYPDSTGTWTVQEKKGNILYIDNNKWAEWFNDARQFYTDELNRLVGSEGYSVWIFEENYQVPFSRLDINKTMQLFDKVIWNGDRDSYLQRATESITSYILSGHILIVTTDLGEGDYDSPPFTFAHIDSITNEVDEIDIGDELQAVIEGYPDLKANRYISHTTEVGFGFLPDENAEPLYILLHEPDPIVGLRYPTGGPASLIFLDFQLHWANGLGTAGDLLEHILNVEFEQ
jgi:hypothetical protein